MVGTGKGNVHSIVLPSCKIFLNDGNRPYREDPNCTDTVARHDETHATENPPPSPLGIDSLGRHKTKILFADNFAISKIGTATNQAPILNAKG